MHAGRANPTNPEAGINFTEQQRQEFWRQARQSRERERLRRMLRELYVDLDSLYKYLDLNVTGFRHACFWSHWDTLGGRHYFVELSPEYALGGDVLLMLNTAMGSMAEVSSRGKHKIHLLLRSASDTAAWDCGHDSVTHRSQ